MQLPSVFSTSVKESETSSTKIEIEDVKKRLAKLTYFLKDEKQELMEYDKRIVIKYT